MTQGIPSILEVRDLSIHFGALIAVDSMNFAIERGKITSVIGPNGAGKSTLFNLICGSLAPSAGRVFLEGRDVTGHAPYRILSAGLARSFQITNLFFDLSVFENLRLAAQILDPPMRELFPVAASRRAIAKAEELLVRFHLESKAGEPAGFLSQGEQRRLEIAVALAAEPRILLLDEPTQGMSHGDTEETAEMIRKLAGDLTILLIEHDINLVMTLSDYVIVMAQGAKLAEGTPSEVRANWDVQTAYFGHGA